MRGNGQNSKSSATRFSREQVLAVLNDPTIRVFDHPQLHRLGEHLIEHPEAPEVYHAHFARGVEQLSWLGTLENHPFRQNLPPFHEPLDIDHWWGQMSDGKAMGARTTAYTRNVGLVGIPGSGKTNALALMLSQLALSERVIVFEQKPELRRLTGLPRHGRLWTPLPFEKIPMPLLLQPPGVSATSWDPIFIECFANNYSLHASRRALQGFLSQAREQQGGTPELGRLTEAVERWQTGRGYREAGYKESLLWTLRSLHSSAPNLNVRDSNALEVLFSGGPGGFIIEATLAVEHYCFVLAWMMLWCSTWRKKKGVRSPNIIFALDDATALLDRQRDLSAPGGINPLAAMMLIGRALGIGVIWITHSFKDVSTKLRAATENYAIFRPSGDDLPNLRSTLGTTPEATNSLRSLAQDQAVILVPSTCLGPQLCCMPFVNVEPDDRVISMNQTAFFDKIKIREPARKDPPRTAERDILSTEQLRLLLEAGFHPNEGLTALYARVGLDRESGRRATDALKHLGFVMTHRVSSGTRGGHLTLLEVSEPGKQELAKRGIVGPDLPTKGAFLHKVGAFHCGEIDRKAGAKVRYEAPVFGVRADMLSEFPDGSLVAYQLGMSDPNYEAKTLPVLIRAPGIARVEFIGKDRAFLRKLEGSLIGTLTLAERARLRMRCLGEVLLKGAPGQEEEKA